jgi:acyl-CoA synthetase (AMP-forming)/AMP-acid ligase II
MRIIDHFDNAVTLYPTNTAFRQVGETDAGLSYADAYPLTAGVADAIRGNGFGAGSHVGILAPNCTEAFIALLGLFRAQCVWLPINPRNTVSVNADLLSRFDGELLLFHSSFAEEAAQLQAECSDIRAIVCIDGDCGTGISLEQWQRGQEGAFQEQPSNLDDLFAIFPTGGTTGQSKGVMLTHRNIHTLFCNFYAHFNYHDDSCHLVVAPMTHTAGLTGCMHFARGGCNAIIASTQPADILDAMEQEAVTHLFLPPTLLYMLLAEPAVEQRDFSKLQHFLVGAAPTSLERLKEALTVFGPVMTEAFGQTEAPASITAKAPWDYLRADGSIDEARLHSIGRPCVFNQVAILADDGTELGTGEAGEICIRGELVCPGYYKNPEATEEARQFGWHHTGDIGVMADDGYITIVDRKKDMIISGGFNVFPNEIEQVISAHDAIQECAVIGVPDDKWGEAVTAVIQLKSGKSCQASDIISLVKQELGSVKAPKHVEFVQDLPRSPVGKVLKTDLRKQYWAGQERAVN